MNGDARDGFLGILMLDTRFPRPVGDIGNPQTFARLGIPGALRDGARRIAAAHRAAGRPGLAAALHRCRPALVQSGARMISTSCGFLALWQAQLAQALPVPVLTSSLLACASLVRPGIVTIDAQALGAATLRAAGVPAQRRCRVWRRAASSSAASWATRPNLTWCRRAMTWCRPAAGWCRHIRTSATSCSNAPTCRRTGRR